jgi:hypothetical protein
MYVNIVDGVKLNGVAKLQLKPLWLPMVWSYRGQRYQSAQLLVPMQPEANFTSLIGALTGQRAASSLRLSGSVHLPYSRLPTQHYGIKY